MYNFIEKIKDLKEKLIKKINLRNLLLCILFVFFVAFYCYTNSFHVTWGGGDSPVWVMSVIKGPIPKFMKPLGWNAKLERLFFYRSDDYPLFTHLGKVFNFSLPGANVAYKINTMVALFGGLTVCMIFLIIKRMTGVYFAAVAGALSLLVSHHFWLESNLGEIYTLYFFIVSVIIYSVVRWSESNKNKYLYAIFLFLGLGLAHHPLIFLVFPPLFIFFLFNIKHLPRDVKVYFLFIFALFTPSLILNSITGFLSSNETGFLANFIDNFNFTASTGIIYIFKNFNLHVLLKYFVYLFYQFPIAGFILGFWGIFAIRNLKRGLPIFLLIFFLFCVLFPSTYSAGIEDIDRPTFYIGSYVLFSIFIGYGVSKLPRRSTSIQKTKRINLLIISVIAILPILTYIFSPILVKRFNIPIGPKNYLPYRDFEWYFLFPPKRWDNSAHRFGTETLQKVEPNAFIYASYTPQYTIRYYQFISQDRWDINTFNIVIPSSDKNYVETFLRKVHSLIYDFPVYLVPYKEPKTIDLEGFVLKDAGPLFKLLPEKRDKDDMDPISDNRDTDMNQTFSYDGEEMVLIPSTKLNIEDFFSVEFGEYVRDQELNYKQIESLIKVFEGAFYIDKYEVSAKQFSEFLNVFGNENEKYMGEDKFANIVKINGRYCPRDNQNFFPANNVTPLGAEMYAKWKGKRLPYTIEWERAATNNYSFRYPWGNNPPVSHLANYYKNWTDFGFGVYSSVNSFPDGANKWGVRQLMGNVMEWVKKMNFNLVIAPLKSQEFIVKCSNRIHSFSKGYLLKGGSWYTFPENINPIKAIDISPAVAYNAYAGFRCVKDIR